MYRMSKHDSLTAFADHEGEREKERKERKLFLIYGKCNFSLDEKKKKNDVVNIINIHQQGHKTLFSQVCFLLP